MKQVGTIKLRGGEQTNAIESILIPFLLARKNTNEKLMIVT
jgi:hypothetical protein